MRRAVVVLLTLVVGVAVPTALARPADARSTPSIEFVTTTPKIDVGTGPRFTYTTHSLGDAATIALQRQLADSSWKTLSEPPKGADLTVTAPALGSPGRYLYRMFSSTGVASPTRVVYAYKDVAVATVCPHTATDQQFPRVCKKKTHQVGSHTLTTSMAIGATKYPNFFAGANIPHTSCRSASLRFTVTDNNLFKGYLKITQGNGAPVLRGQATAAVAHIGTLNVTFATGKLYINGATESPNGGSVFIAGTFSCWTTTGTY